MGLWEDDAFIRDKASGQYFDKDKMHELNYEGEFFKIAGPLNIERSPQGQPIIFQAGASPKGSAFASRNADAVFTNASTLEKAQATYADLRQQAADNGRNPDEIKVFPTLQPIVGKDHEEVRARYDAIKNLVTIEEALAYPAATDHHDLHNMMSMPRP